MKLLPIDTALVFCDGACSGNPGPGGWGAIVHTPENGVQELGGARNRTTNNQMELTACLKALENIKTQQPQIHVFTDSTYLIRGITQWVWGWQKRGWKTAENADVLNQEIWQDLITVTKGRLKDKKIQWHYVRGHTGIPGNERCDQIAVIFRDSQSETLFQGPLNHYSIDLLQIPDDTSLPQMKSPGQKSQPVSYLSYLDGKVERHLTWSDCERRVKGRSGAKFKKAMSETDEEQILASWGTSRKDLK